MNRIAAIFLLIYYSFGTLLLPAGDFSYITALPEMYSQCKQTEDADMNLLDFFTDHLLNIDCLVDPHEKGDKQRPHQTSCQRNHIPSVFYATEKIHLNSRQNPVVEFVLLPDIFSLSVGYVSDVFRPPVSGTTTA